MAKGARASSRKKNNAKLRANVFGPAHDARTERLSAKLQQLAAAPKPEEQKVMDIDQDAEKEAPHEKAEVKEAGTKMKEARSEKSKVLRKSKSSGRITKMSRKRAKGSNLFPGLQIRQMRQEARKRRT